MVADIKKDDREKLLVKSEQAFEDALEGRPEQRVGPAGPGQRPSFAARSGATWATSIRRGEGAGSGPGLGEQDPPGVDG